MALKDRIAADIGRTFMNLEHFAEYHNWDGKRILCVPDDEEALKRKNNNVNDISWDNNVREILLHTPLKDFPGGEPEPNTQIFLDGRTLWVKEVGHNMGMLHIRLSAKDPREIM